MKITPSHTKRLNFQLRTPVLGGLLLCAALSSSALTVGRMRGAAWLGQPLDVSIQVQLDETESLSALCFDAEVLHADTRQDAARVRVSVESGAQPNMAQVRVQSAVAVDEPVVSVYLREGCVSKTSRRYVLLSELPGAIVPSATLATAAPVASRPAAAPVMPQKAPAASAPRPDRLVPPPGALVQAPAVKKPVQASQNKPAATAVPRKQEQAVAIRSKGEPTGKPQLKLDPLSSLSERVAQLEDITLAAHSTDGEREAQRLKKMEENVAALLALAAKNERGMTELRERLQQAESEKYDNPLVYGLVALLLTALGAAAYFWRRQQQVASDWWRGESEGGADMTVSATPRAVAKQEVQVAAAASVIPVVVAVSEPLAAVTQPEPQAASLPVADVDLDDLMATIVSETPGSVQSAEALAQSLPELMPVPPAEEVAAAQSQEVGLPAVDAMATYEFPAAGEVTIDISHLSLSPVAPPSPTADGAPAEVLLDFDFPDFGKTDAQEPGDDTQLPRVDSKAPR